MVPKVDVALMANLCLSVFCGNLLESDTPAGFHYAQSMFGLFCAKNHFDQLTLVGQERMGQEHELYSIIEVRKQGLVVLRLGRKGGLLHNLLDLINRCRLIV
jgi:hypothetical protein